MSMMVLAILLVIILSLIIIQLVHVIHTTQLKDKEIVTIKVETKGAETTRIDNLVGAAELLNEELDKEGSSYEVVIDTAVFNGTWKEYEDHFIKEYKENSEADILTIGHDAIAWLAKANYILPLDQLRTSEAYKDVYDILWRSTKWRGKTWGAIQDTEVRPIYVNVKKLRELGWSDTQISALPGQVIKGEFTLNDMTAVAKEAKDKGIVKWGVIHRPKNGPEFHMMAMNFGTQIYDLQLDQLIYDRQALLAFFEYIETISVTHELLPTYTTDLTPNDIYQMVIDDEVLFYYGGIWNVFNFQQLGAEYERIMEDFAFILIPSPKKGGKPMTLSHPLIYTVSSQTEHPDLVIRLLELAAAPEFQVTHALETKHLPVTKTAASTEAFKADSYLSSIMYMLEYTTFIPNNENFNVYTNIFYDTICGIEKSRLTPEEAVEYMENELVKVLGESFTIKP